MVESEWVTVESLVEKELKPYVQKIDKEAFYARHFLRKLGEIGAFSSLDNHLEQELKLIETVAKTCMTTAFCLWCHFAALTYIRNSENETLKNDLLPLLETGEILGGTGLSNPMKYYANLEKLHLKAKKADHGYEITGVLPAVSNLAENHVFAFIAEENEQKRIMGFVAFQNERLEKKAKLDYLGLNGSATYACKFNRVFVPNERIVTENPDEYIQKIRPYFMLYQIPLGIGIIKASIECIENAKNLKNGCNHYLPVQADALTAELNELKAKLQDVIARSLDWREVAALRLKTAYIALKAVETAMLHQGGAGYLKYSHASRRLREAYFFANLTPTIKHLEKLLAS